MRLIKNSIIFILLFLGLGVQAQKLEVLVNDSASGNAVINALVWFEGTEIMAYTNSAGIVYFSEDQISGLVEGLDLPKYSISGPVLQFQHDIPSRITLINAAGQMVYVKDRPDHVISFASLPAGIYFLQIHHREKLYQSKLLYTNGKIINSAAFLYDSQYLKVSIRKDGYWSKSAMVKLWDINNIALVPSVSSSKDYLTEIDNSEQFKSIEGVPLNPFFGEVSSVKFLYGIRDDKMYYINSKVHLSHSYFAMSVLNYPKNNYYFNLEQYADNPNRIYYPGTIDYFKATDRYVLQFFSSDDISCDAIQQMYEKIKQTCFFKDALSFYANTTRTQACGGMAIVTSDELFEGQNYQCLNPEETYGYLRKVDIEALNSSEPGRRDIVLLNGNPVDISVVAGIITTDFQTPLSHINVLSINRKTPNMVLRDGWTNDDLLQFENKLVYLNASIASFEIREASLAEAQVFWDSREPHVPVVLVPDTTTSGIIEPDNFNLDDIDVVGGKAANFGEMAGIYGPYGKIPLPEGAFAIPFYYYHQHMKTNGLDRMLASMLLDPSFQNNISIRRASLETLRDAIKDAPLDVGLKRLVEQRILKNNYLNTRFRSSTNAEDIEGFNGAGLYDSKTGIPGDEEKSIEEAIKKVWASLWNFRAFEERAYFKIDQQSVAMGILAHRSFPDEKANGVLITKNIYRDFLPAFTINCQFDEISVVNPEGGWQPEQLLYYIFPGTEANPVNYLNYSNVPGHDGQRVMTDEELYRLSQNCMAIIDHYAARGINKTLDIEFKIDEDENGNRVLIIKQCRILND